MTLSLSHVHLKTPDPKKTIQFYIDNFGATIKGEMASGYQLNLHGLQLNVTTIMATQNHEQHHGIEHLAIESTDYDSTMATVRKNGVQVLEQFTSDTGRRVAFLMCPDGAQMEIIEKK
ncbi:MAG: hypothetical protein EXR01_08500 [Acetobacteraceae bacterium]|nr:hypothetical protein [Acetobacteraceae bacterium]